MVTTYIVNPVDHPPGTASLHRRLGRTWTRMIDQVYVELYEEATREMADAIHAIVRERLAERPVAES